MLRVRNLVIVFLLLTLSVTTIYASLYVPNNRDTSPNPEETTYSTELQKYPNQYVLMYSSDKIDYYYREDRDIFAMQDKETGHIWKTGLDVPYRYQIRDVCDDALGQVQAQGEAQGLSPEEIDTLIDAKAAEVCEPYENRLNETFTSLANSLITVEMYSDQDYTLSKYSSSTYVEDPDIADPATITTSRLLDVVGEDNHKIFEVDFNAIDLHIKVHIYFTDLGLQYEIKDDEITGEGQKLLHDIIFTPFMGASGGEKTVWDPESNRYNLTVKNDMIPGYVLVPDGSGGLIRFRDNNTKITDYEGDVYGEDLSQALVTDHSDPWYVPLKVPSMPLFGIAQGDDQFAFLSYAESGGEYMSINVEPEESMTYYTYAFPSFTYNRLYAQVYNQQGWGYQTLFEERNHFNIKLSYDILEVGGYSPNYVGMAKRYRDYLIENDMLQDIEQQYSDIPTRIDFVMSDVEKNIIGYSNVVVTNTNGVDRILQDIYDNGVRNINTGLLGWQDGGITTNKPWKTDFASSIGSKREFENLISKYKALGIDISFIQDYFKFNEEQVNKVGNAVKHISSWYIRNYASAPNLAIYEFYYARPYKSVEWAQDQLKDIDDLAVSSYTIYGITNNLIGDYSKGYNSVTQTIQQYQAFFDGLDDNIMINAYRPNDYLWKYVDRYIDTPVYTSQYIIESDTVPFLQLVLSDSMELYAPYSNFSFYNQTSILRMIDYNVFPSFVLTDESPNLLKDTNSNGYYSTQYAQYKDMIQNIYSQVNGALKSVINADWVNREVYEPGVIINTYSNELQVVINYTDEIQVVNGFEVQPLSYRVIEEVE